MGNATKTKQPTQKAKARHKRVLKKKAQKRRGEWDKRQQRSMISVVFIAIIA